MIPAFQFQSQANLISVFLDFPVGKALEQLHPLSSYPIFHLKRRVMIHTVIDQLGYTILEGRKSILYFMLFHVPLHIVGGLTKYEWWTIFSQLGKEQKAHERLLHFLKDLRILTHVGWGGELPKQSYTGLWCTIHEPNIRSLGRLPQAIFTTTLHTSSRTLQDP